MSCAAKKDSRRGPPVPRSLAFPAPPKKNPLTFFLSPVNLMACLSLYLSLSLCNALCFCLCFSVALSLSLCLCLSLSFILPLFVSLCHYLCLCPVFIHPSNPVCIPWNLPLFLFCPYIFLTLSNCATCLHRSIPPSLLPSHPSHPPSPLGSSRLQTT